MMMKLPLMTCLVTCLSFVTFQALAICNPNPPEPGDIGPSSELVCRDLEQRFPDAVTAVENRTIRSPASVEIVVSVDGQPVVLGYDLEGFAWKPIPSEQGTKVVGTGGR